MLELQFHWYGFIIGLACAIGFYVTLFKARQHRIKTDFIEESFIPVLLGGIIGARLYHVVTDFGHYTQHIDAVWRLDQGGLSVIGAVLGGGLAWYGWYRYRQPNLKFATYLDLAVLALPISQAVGRVANYVNHELYGLPTQLPWAITIPPQYRLAGHEAFATYHPLFLYEMILSLLGALGLWWWDRRSQSKSGRFGQGWFFLSYVVYYCFFRTGLEFLRLEKAVIGQTGLGVNQVVLLLVGIISAGYLYSQVKRQLRKKV